MKIDFQKLGEILNECVNEEMFIRVGRYEGDYHLGDGQFEKIKGELFIKTNSDTIFRVVSDDSNIFDDFDIIGSDAIVTPINKELENKKIKYEEYCVRGSYSIVIEAESEEEAIKKAMTMQLNQMDIADVDFINDMDYRQ